MVGTQRPTHLSGAFRLGHAAYSFALIRRLTSVNGMVYTWDNNGNPSTGSGQACCRTACAATPIPTPTASPRS